MLFALPGMFAPSLQLHASLPKTHNLGRLGPCVMDERREAGHAPTGVLDYSGGLPTFTRLRGGGPTGYHGSTCVGDDAAEAQDEAKLCLAEDGTSHLKSGDLWRSAASSSLHWYNVVLASWLHKVANDADWSGWTAVGATPTTLSASGWQAFDELVDESERSFVRWFVGATTNAAFNELDRHVLEHCSKETAFIDEPAAGAPVLTNRAELLQESTLAAHVLCDTLGIECGNRIAIHQPNSVQAVVWIAAAKRLGAPYAALAAGITSALLADRLADTAASLLVTCSVLADTASAALTVLVDEMITVLATDEATIPNGWRAASTLLLEKRTQLLAMTGVAPCDLHNDNDLVRNLWLLTPPRPVDASHPLFILYTSGSTGELLKAPMPKPGAPSQLRANCRP